MFPCDHVLILGLKPNSLMKSYITTHYFRRHLSSRNSLVHGNIQSFAVSNSKTFSGNKSQTSNIEKSPGENDTFLPSEDTVRFPNFTEVVCRSFKCTVRHVCLLTTGIFETIRDTVKLR